MSATGTNGPTTTSTTGSTPTAAHFLRTFTALPEGVLERLEALEQLRALEHGHRIKVVVTPHDSVEVDTPAELERVRRLITGEEQS